MVFNGVVGATVEDLCDVSPLVLVFSVHQEQDPLLFTSPVYFLDSGVQMIVPTFTTLLAHATGKGVSDTSPAART